MKSVCMVFEVTFQRVLEGMEKYGAACNKAVHAVNCDPPYNTRRSAELSISEHDLLGLQDLSHLVELLSALMHLSAQEHMFWSILQFKRWYELLVGKVQEVVKRQEGLDSEKPAAQSTAVLKWRRKCCITCGR